MTQAKRCPSRPAGRACFADRIGCLLTVDGRKRHIITDTLGLILFVLIHAANIRDRDGAVDLVKAIRDRFPWLRHLFADGTYAGEKLSKALARLGQWTLEIVKRPDAAKGFVVLSRRLRGLLTAFPPGIGSKASWPLMAGRAHFRLARTMSQTCQGLGALHRKLNRMGAHHPYPTPHTLHRNPLSDLIIR